MSNIEGDKISNVGPAKGNDKQRKIPKRSAAWDHFDYDKETKRAKCKRCGANYSADSKKAGTRNLNSHLKKCLKREEINDDVFNEEQNEVLPGKNAGTSHLKDHLQACTSSANKEEINNFVFDQKRNLELFAKMVIHGKIPLQYVENPLFTEFARSLQPMYTHVDRMAVEKQCLSCYENEKNKLQDEFFKLTSRVSFLVGIYHQQQEDDTSKKQEEEDEEDVRSFIIVEAHFINDDFKLVKRIICFNEILDDRNDYMVAEVERCVYGWGLGKKVLTCAATVDNGSLDIDWRSHISSGICGGEHIKVELFAVCLWVIASLVYEEVEPYVGSIRMMIEQFQDPMVIKWINEIADKHSFPRKPEFVIDHMRKWHSVLNMLRDALSYKTLLDSDQFDSKRWRCVDPLSWEEWNDVERALELWEIIYHALSSSCPTSNIFLKIYFEIQDMFSKISAAIKGWDCISDLQGKLHKYLVGCNKMLFVASVLDPRFKFKLINRCDMEKEVYQFLQDLYNDYKKVRNVANCCVFSELETYLKEDHAVVGDAEVLDWWKDKKTDYPVLSIMARDILAIPLSSSFLPFGFDSFNEIFSLIRSSRVGINMTEALVCGNNIEASEFLPLSCLNGKVPMFEQERSRELLVKLIISSELPFKFVKNPSFMEWTEFLQPLYIPEEQGTIRNECLALYENYRNNMNNFGEPTFKAYITVGRLASTGWIYIREHFIDDDFNLVRRLTGVHYTGHESSSYVHEDNNYCLRCGSRQPHGSPTPISCFVYILQKIAIDIISYNNSLIKSIQKMTSHVAETPNAMNIFNKIAVHNNVPTKIEFVLDNRERWDCSLDMLHDALIYKDVFDAYEGYDKYFSSCKKWEEVERVVKLLKPIYEAVIMLSSDKYATSNLILKAIAEIRDIFLEASTALERRLDTYEPLQRLTIYLESCKKIFLVASSILDPRFKLLYVEGTIKNFNEELIEFCEKYGNMISKNACTVDGVSLVVNGSAELERYLKESKVNVTDPNFNVLTWWKIMKSKYPVLSRMAQDILAIPASSVLYQFSFTLSTAKLSFGSFVDNDICTFKASFCLKDWISATYGSDGLCLGQSSILKLSALDSIDEDSRNEHASSLLHGGLTIREIAAIEFVKKHIASSSKKILVIMKDIVLTAKTMECLIIDDGPNNWINDEVMDCCINILNVTRKQLPYRSSSLILSTSQSQWLCSPSKEEKVTSSIVETGQNFLIYNKVFCPIKINKHWFVVVWYAREYFYILNFKASLDSYDHEIIRSLIIGIQKCIMTANGTSPELHFEELDEDSFRLCGPQQKDCRSCDLYALKCMDLIWDWDWDWDLDWDWESELDKSVFWQLSQKYINLFRKKLVAELIFSELNERTDIQKECLVEVKVHDFGRWRPSVFNLSAIEPTKKDVLQLSLQERAAIEFVRKHTAKEVIKMDDIIVKTDKLKCLTNSTTENEQDKWINDDVMNCYINILNKRRKPNTIIVSTLHSQWLCSSSSIESSRQPFSMVKFGKNFLDCKLVFFPINIENAHWFVGILNIEKNEFHILNSLKKNSMGETREITRLKLNIQACIKAASPCQTKNILNSHVSVIPNIPQQRDKSSCGLFALKYMELWNGSGLDVDFSQDYVDLFRNKLVAELIFSELNERKDIQNEINMSIQEQKISQ